MYASKQTGKTTAVVRLWRTDQQDRDGKPKLLQQIPVFAKKVRQWLLLLCSHYNDRC